MADKKLEPAHDLGEAPASASVKVKDADGFNWIFTVRDEKAFTLLDKMKLLTAQWKANGWTPIEERSFGGFPKKEVPTKPCPVHKDAVLKEKQLKDGTKLWSHSQGTYPNLTWCNGAGFPQERSGYNAVANQTNEIPERDVSDF